MKNLNIKIAVQNQEEFSAVQKYAFENGVEWLCGGTIEYTVFFPYVFIQDGKITVSKCDDTWDNEELYEIDYHMFTAMRDCKDQVREFLTDVKIAVNSSRSEEFQNLCFLFDIPWNGTVDYSVKHLESQYIYVDNELGYLVISYSISERYFVSNSNEKITLSDVIDFIYSLNKPEPEIVLEIESGAIDAEKLLIILNRKLSTGEPLVQKDIDDIERLTAVPVQEPDFEFISKGYEFRRQSQVAHTCDYQDVRMPINRTSVNLGELDVVLPDEVLEKYLTKFSEAPVRLGITILD